MELIIIREGFADNNEVRIHYIDSNPNDTSLTALVICPGLSEPAEDYLKLVSSLSPRRVVVLSFRGRGKSDSPHKGYSLEHHIGDINAVIKAVGLQKFCLMGYSRGVSYALGYGLENPNFLIGLILEEYPAEHKQMPKGWANEYISFLKRDPSNQIKLDAILGIEEESHQVSFWSQLSKIKCPVLIMRGSGQESQLSPQQVDMYLTHWKNAKIEVFNGSGHDIQTDNYDEFVQVIKDFMESLD